MTSSLRCLVLGLAALVLSACSLFGLDHLRPPSSRGPDAQGRVLAGSICDEVLYPLDARDTDEVEIDDDRIAVLLASCHRSRKTLGTGHEVEQKPRFRTPWVLARHKRFDDRVADPVAAGLIAVECAFADHCARGRGTIVDDRDPLAIGSHHGTLGMIALYAEIADDARVRARLAELGLDEVARDAFVGRIAAVRTAVAPELAAMSEAQRGYAFDGPRRLLGDRRADYARNQARHAALDRLAAGKATPEAIAAIEALRSDYAKACRKAGCRHDLFYLAATRALVLHHVAAGDALGVALESELLDDPEAGVLAFATALYEHQQAIERQASEARARERKADDAGVGGAARKAVVGEALPLRIGTETIWPAADRPSWREVLGANDVVGFTDEVKAVKTVGDRSTISFTSKSHVVHEPYACRRSNRVERIESDGTLRYEEHCRYRARTIVDPAREPIRVPAAEAAKLRKGEYVHALQRGDVARVVSVTRGDALVQWRADRFAVAGE